MINSNERKLALSGWLKNTSYDSYINPLKLQKFLFFYESFSKVKNKETDFTYLKGFKNGPVFSNVYGDYTHERKSFNEASDKIFKSKGNLIINSIANKVDFLVKILTSNELSELTHKMNIWKAKKDRILSGERNVELSESDFDSNDVEIIMSLDSMYTNEIINNYNIVNVGKNHFLVEAEKMKNLSPEYMDILYILSNNEDLKNPVYIDFDESGRLIVD